MSKIVRTSRRRSWLWRELLLERGLESLTGLDFVDGLFAVSGSVLAALSVNRDLSESCCPQHRANVRQGSGNLRRQWRRVQELNPKTAEWLEKALKICMISVSFLTSMLAGLVTKLGIDQLMKHGYMPQATYIKVP